MSDNPYKLLTDNNPDVVVTLVAQSDRTCVEWADLHNASFYLLPVSQATNGPARKMFKSPDGARKALAPDSQISDRVKSQVPALQINFSTKPKIPELGYLLGSDPKLCDIILGSQEEKISHVMFSISINPYNEVIMKSWSSTQTAVMYGSQTVKRGLFTWTFPSNQTTIFVIVPDTIMFAVVVPTHETDIIAYEAKCRKSMMLADSASHTLKMLDFLSTKTASGMVVPQAATEPPFYLRMEKVGKGGFGDVYKARSMPSGRTVAVKLFKTKKACKLESDVLKELSKFPHDHIIEFFDYGLGVRPHLVMGLAFGGNLEEQNRIHEFNLTETVLILRQMLDALVHLHVHFKMMHRDIKPVNILCDSRTHFRLADFGLAKEGDVLKTRQGTKSYMAPEMYTDEPYTAAVDLWGLGMVISWLVSRSWPRGFRGDEGLRWCEAIVAHFKEYEKKCSRAMVNDHVAQNGLNFLVVRHMLRIEPKDRESAIGCLDRGEFLWYWLDQVSKRNGETPTPEDRAKQKAACKESEALEEEVGSGEESTPEGGEQSPQEKHESSTENVSEAETEIPANSNDWSDLEREFPYNPADVRGNEGSSNSLRHFVHARSIGESGNVPEHTTTTGSSRHQEPSLHRHNAGINKRKRYS